MVDVSAKPETERVATAGCRVVLASETLELLGSPASPKGDALAVARVAGIMGAKRTPELIPLCHPLPITGVEVDLALEADAVRVTATEPHHRSHRGRDGGADRRRHRRPDPVRHGQGGPARRPGRGPAPAGQARRPPGDYVAG